MSENDVIELPDFKEKKRRSSKNKVLTLPVKNEILFGIRILSTDVKPIRKKIKGKKSKRYLVPILLVSKDIISQKGIDKIIKAFPREAMNYPKIEKFGVDKACNWSLAKSHYDILKMWLKNNKVGIGNLMYFNRFGFDFDSKYFFRTESEGKKFLDDLAKEKERIEKENQKTKK